MQHALNTGFMSMPCIALLRQAYRCGVFVFGSGCGAVAKRPNNSFKPNLLRSSKSVAEKTCHAFASTTQVGLIQVLCAVGQVVSCVLAPVASFAPAASKAPPSDSVGSRLRPLADLRPTRRCVPQAASNSGQFAPAGLSPRVQGAIASVTAPA